MIESGSLPNGTVEDQRRRFAQERAAIDASTRGPVLLLFTASLVWLLIGSVFGLLSSYKLHDPTFLTLFAWGDSWSWLRSALTFGRLRPAHLNAVAYGWGTQVGLGVSLWLMARLSRTELIYPRLLIAAGLLWNLGVLLGIVGILAGSSTGIEWLEFPPFVPPILATAFVFVAVWGIVTFSRRREKHVYVTQWYVFGGLLWLPAIYLTVCLLLLYTPVTGVPQAAVNWWFAHNFLGLWLTPVGVGAAYYLIPKVIGRPIHSYYLSILGFWSLALFYSWAGIHHLIGGPLPTWLQTASIVGSVMMFVPVGAVAVNHHMTMLGHFHKLRTSPTLRFVVFGAMAYTAASAQGSLQALRSVNEITHWTHYTVAHAHLGIYAFYTMVMFGAMYYIVPRLTGQEWYSARLISAHFWLTAVGIALYVVALSIGGWFQGEALIDRSGQRPPFIAIVLQTVPYLQWRSVAGLLMTLGHFVFAWLLLLNLLRYGSRRPSMVVAAGVETSPAVMRD